MARPKRRWFLRSCHSEPNSAFVTNGLAHALAQLALTWRTEFFRLPAWRKKAVAKETVAASRLKSSALLDTRVVYCGDNLEQLAKLPDACVDFCSI
jgi:hypothetical protein